MATRKPVLSKRSVKPVVSAEVKLALTEKDLPRIKGKWKEANGSVDEVSIVNVVSFLTPKERIHLVNELYRVMKDGAKCQIVAPHWCSNRAYGDMSFQWPPVSESWFAHLNKEWREKEAPWGKDYKCDFDVPYGYGMHPLICSRNQEYQQNALTFYKEAAQDIVATLIKRPC